MRLTATGCQGREGIIDFRLFHSGLIRTARRGRNLSETTPCAAWRETRSMSSIIRRLIDMDAQDAQDYLARVSTVMSSTIALFQHGFPKTRSRALGSLPTPTRSSSGSASCGAASPAVYPVYPVYPCSISRNPFSTTWPLFPTGHEDSLFHSRMIRPVVGAGAGLV